MSYMSSQQHQHQAASSPYIAPSTTAAAAAAAAALQFSGNTVQDHHHRDYVYGEPSTGGSSSSSSHNGTGHGHHLHHQHPDVAAMNAVMELSNAASHGHDKEVQSLTDAHPKRKAEARESQGPKRTRLAQQHSVTNSIDGGGPSDSSASGSALTGQSGDMSGGTRSASDPHRASSGRQLSNSKRAQQNREAQRAFRQRKDQHVKELEQKAASLERALTSGEDHKRRCAEVTAQLEEISRDNERLRIILHQHGLSHLIDGHGSEGAGVAGAAAESTARNARAGLDNASSAQEPFYGASTKKTHFKKTTGTAS